MTDEVYFRADLALVHERAFGFHADRVAAGVLALLEPVLRDGGLVLEIGCGTGRLTTHLVGAGHRVLATDASPAMLQRAGEVLGGAAQLQLLRMPDDPLPPATAVVAVGHPLNYLPDEVSVHTALARMADALRPGGVLAVDVCDLAYASDPTRPPSSGLAGPDWAIVTRFERPSPSKYVRELTTFVATPDGGWRRDDERHENVLVDARLIPPLLARHGVDATLGAGFGIERLPPGLVTVVGRREA